jgi:hypothetical protein
MRPSLVRLAEAQPSLVQDYLVRQQIPLEIAEWKYFDSRFSRGQERGFVCMKENKVCGFLGLIPFKAQKEARTLECAWSCDWSVDASQVAGGMGIMLIKQAKEAYDAVFNVGGNENTRRIFPRLADRTVWDAGVSLVLPLRLGAILTKLAPPFLQRPLAQTKFLHHLPLKWIRTAREDDGVQIEPGVPEECAPLFEDPHQGEWCPLYDYEYVRWQLVTCPAVASYSCYIPAQPAPRAAAVIWRSAASTDFWRLAFWGVRNSAEEARSVIRRAIQFVYEQRGAALSAIASHLDQELISLLSAQGFLQRRARLPFYGMRGRDAKLTFDEFGVLSFLDADLPYRFD